MGYAKKKEVNKYKADYNVTAIQYDVTAGSILSIERLLGEHVYLDEVINSLVSNVKGITIPPFSYLIKDSISDEFSVLNEDEFNKRFKEI